jgi:hypothetical protein
MSGYYDAHDYTDYDDEDPYDPDPIEGYCMHCRQSVEIEEPAAVWTRKGQAATRGTCPICGGNVFRMGKTHLHSEADRPQAVLIGEDKEKRKRPRLERGTVYISFAAADEAQAQQIADDLQKSGLAIWLHDNDDQASWASGVHPALKECGHMVYVLSAAALDDAQATAAWQFFKASRKPIVIAQIAPADPPDAIRRSPRYDFSANYKASLRQMVGALSE